MNSLSQPSPKWYRITKKVWALTENTVILLLLATGHTDSSLTMIIYKISSSYLKEVLDAVMVSDKEEYAKKDEGGN